MKRVMAFFVLGLSLLIADCTSTFGAFGGQGGYGWKDGVLYFEPSDEAFANPMKGFRPARYLNDTSFPTGEYVSVVHHLIKYNELESSSGDTAQKIIDWCNRVWAGLEQRNVKVIPRVIIVNPGTGEFWPGGLDSSDPVRRWISEPFKQRMAAFIEKLGEAWDNDPRVAAVEAGIWGNWGEHHIHPLTLPGGGDRIPPDVQKVMGDAFTRAFKNKKVMVRYPGEFTNYNFGYYWDSFGLPEDRISGELIILRGSWREAMNSGEVAYDWGTQSVVGGSPDGTLKSAEITDHMIDWVKRTHTSSLGWVANYTQTNAALSENAARLQKAFGYRFVVQSAVYNQAVDQGGKLSLEFAVANTGSAPFYYQWPVEVSLLDRRKNPVWTGLVHVDIRNWRPGHVYTVRDEFAIPEDIAKGTYTLALAVLDPAGNMPSLRFANKNYYNGGRMPLGTIGIGQQPGAYNIGPFDSLYRDHSLKYKLEPASAPVEDRQHYPPVEDEQQQADINLALRKPVIASSVESAYDNYAEKAVDGNPSTRWSSEWNIDPSWITVDLVVKTAVNRVKLSWEGSYAVEYEIQVSDNGTSWKTVYHTREGKGNAEAISFPAVEARYVRLYCIKRALQWGYSIYEIEIYAP
jgi:hypothetical protein